MKWTVLLPDYKYEDEVYFDPKRNMKPIDNSELKKFRRNAALDIKMENIQRMSYAITQLTMDWNQYGHSITLSEDAVAESVGILLSTGDEGRERMIAEDIAGSSTNDSNTSSPQNDAVHTRNEQNIDDDENDCFIKPLNSTSVKNPKRGGIIR